MMDARPDNFLFLSDSHSETQQSFQNLQHFAVVAQPTFVELLMSCYMLAVLMIKAVDSLTDVDTSTFCRNAE